MTKHIVYIANTRMPTERAQGIQIAHTCESMVKAGAQVNLIVPWRFNYIHEDVQKFYGLSKRFDVTRVPSVDLVRFGKVGYIIQEKSFVIFAAIKIMFMSKDSVIYVRDQDVFRMLTKLVRGRSIFLESHQKPNDISKFKPAFERASGVVVITKYYEKELRDMGLRKVLCAPDGVKIEHFDIDISRDDARKKLGLPLGKKLVVYTGHLYPWKGANTLADSANVIDMDTLIVFVGGADNDLDDFKKRYGMVKNILILGQKPHAEIPLYLKAADVVVIPNTSRENISRLYTSPIKLFEYMASGRPIIVSDLPSMRDVLSENNAVFATPDDPQSFAEAITNTLKNVELIQKISTEARRDVEKYSWDIRARNILAFIDLNSKNILQV